MTLKIQQQNETEAHVGMQGHVVIRQECPANGEQVVTLTPETAEQLLAALPELIAGAKIATAEWWKATQPKDDHA